MPNAKELTETGLGKPKFLLSGASGSGKTAQFLTLPGKTFLYLFDPSSLSTIRGFDVEYEMFVPKVASLSTRSLSKDVGDPKKLKVVDAHEIYLAWEKDIEAKMESGFFDTFDNIGFDSFTTFSDIVMDRVLHLNSRTGQWPQQDDWTAQMNGMKNVVRTLTGQMDLTLICTAHEDLVQDELTHRVMNQIILTGKLRQKIPILFSDVWHLECQIVEGKAKYIAQTKPDKMNPSCRTSFRELDQFNDVTIRDWNSPKEYGIGALLKKHNFAVRGE